MRYNFGFGFEHFAAMLATLLGRAGLRGGQLRRGRRARGRGGRRLGGARARPCGRACDRPPPALVALAVASPVAGDPLRRELHDPVRQHLPLAVRGRGLRAVRGRPGLAAAGRRRGRQRRRCRRLPRHARRGWCCRVVAIALLRARRARAGRAARCAGWPGRGWCGAPARAAVLLAVLAAAVAGRRADPGGPRRAEPALPRRRCPINALRGFFSREAYAAPLPRLGARSSRSSRRGRSAGRPRRRSILVAAAFALALAPGGGCDRRAGRAWSRSPPGCS